MAVHSNAKLSACLLSPLTRCVKILDSFICALFDTGSCNNFLSKEYFDDLRSKRHSLSLNNVSTKSVLSASGDSMVPLGAVTLNVKIDRFSWPITFQVIDGLSVHCILGLPFFAKTQAVIDLASRQIYFKFCPCHKLSFCNVGTHVSDDLPVPQPVDNIVSFPTIELSHLSSSQRHDLLILIQKFPHVLTERLGSANVLEHEIKLVDAIPVRSVPYRLPPHKSQALNNIITQMLRDDVIRHSTSHYASPVFLVDKPNGEFRPIIDYRKLNHKILVDQQPMPHINTCFHHFQGAKFFTSLDLNSAYFQVPLKEECKHVTAFITDSDLYEFNRVPFGIATGSGVLARLINSIFADVKFRFLFSYSDDLLVYSPDFSSHMEHLRVVFTRLAEAGLTVNPNKVKYATSSVSFLGHIISPRGIHIDPARTQTIAEYPSPRNVKEVARFVGMVNFFSKFIPHFALKAEPLNRLRKKDVPFQWGEEQQRAFQKLKDDISSPPILALPDFEKSFVVQTDSSSLAVAAVLLQEHEGFLLPLHYVSRRLGPAEMKYTVFEKEALAVLLAFDRFHIYLDHKPFELYTDNSALTYCLSGSKHTGRLARWALKLSAYKYVVRHIRGTDNVVADALSRMYQDEDLSSGSCSVNVANIDLMLPDLFTDMSQHQNADDTCKAFIERLRNGEILPGYKLRNDVLLHRSSRDTRFKVYLPDALVPAVFGFYHESELGGHLGKYKTFHKINEVFFRPGLSKDIAARVAHCSICKMSKPAQFRHYGLLASDVASVPMQKIYIDYMGKLPRTRRGNAFVLVVVDAFSKFLWLFPVRNATTALTISTLRDLFAITGVPRVLVSDNASYFVSNEFKKFLFSLGIQHARLSPYHPAPNICERYNRTLKSALIAYHSSDHSRWDSNLHWVQLALNTARHESTRVTPFSLFHSFVPNNPLSNFWSLADLLPEKIDPSMVRENWTRARKNLQAAHERVRRYYNPLRKESPFQIGDLVFLRNHPRSQAAKQVAAKFAPRFLGPYVIRAFTTPVSVLLQHMETGVQTRAHVQDLKKA